MDLKSISAKAKALLDKRGGTDSLKGDAEDLKAIASGEGSMTDKAKAALAALKDPGETPEAVPDAESSAPKPVAEGQAAAPPAAADAPLSAAEPGERRRGGGGGANGRGRGRGAGGGGGRRRGGS